MKSGFLEKLLDRLDRIDPIEAQQLLSRLIREKGFLEQVFEALHEGVIVLDPEGKVSFINHAAKKFFGISDEIIGQELSKSLHGLEWDAVAHPTSTLSRDLEVFYPENRFLNFYISPINHTDGQQNLGWVMLVRDQTQSRAEHESNLETERMNALTLLAAGVAHEIGNPLNSLDIHLQLMERKLRKLAPANREILQEHLATSRREIKRLDTILRQFLEAIRPTTPKRERCQLQELIRESLALLEPELSSRKIQVELDFTDDFPTLLLDAAQFQQVFYNLLRNAYQAIRGDGGKIKIQTRQGEYDCRVSISDNGSGISPEFMGTLFEPFQTSKQEGTGLGLLIVRRVVREHGGEIEIESEPDRGTSIQIYLPLGPKPMRLLTSHAEVIDVD